MPLLLSLGWIKQSISSIINLSPAGQEEKHTFAFKNLFPAFSQVGGEQRTLLESISLLPSACVLAWYRLSFTLLFVKMSLNAADVPTAPLVELDASLCFNLLSLWTLGQRKLLRVQCSEDFTYQEAPLLHQHRNLSPFHTFSLCFLYDRKWPVS